MPILIDRALDDKMSHRARIRQHSIRIDEGVANGGEDLGPTPHDLYDTALGSCKALTVLWYATRKRIPVEGIEVRVDRDDSDERKGTYRLRVTLGLSGPLSEEQRQELLMVADKCPIHRLMGQATTEIHTELRSITGP